ncbi:MAG: alanine racemase [Candidatus Eisenbacteria bacterium]|nr:alanine racemase [Candidatus Eisenbacteria bacterium]
MLHTSTIEISRSALQRNLRFLRNRLGRGTRFCSVVKANAYGHGIEVFVPLAEECGIDRFAVFSAAEAERVAASCTRPSELMIMGAITDDELEWAVTRDISFFVFDPARLDAAIAAARRTRKPARIHLELETGMNRTGLEPQELEPLAERIRAHPGEIVVEGVCTHFAGAESIANRMRVLSQFERFQTGLDQLRQAGISPGLRHTACSAATLTFPESVLDMARIGIAQYGFWPSPETRIQYALQRDPEMQHRFIDPLSQVLTWRSRVMSLKRLRPGSFVGYGVTRLVTREHRAAVVPVGYAHGFPRSLSNLGYVLIGGRRAPVMGLVNMTMIIVDVTDCHDVRRGDEVVLIGKQNRHTITVQSFSELTRNVNYEVLARLPADIPRQVVP